MHFATSRQFMTEQKTVDALQLEPETMIRVSPDQISCDIGGEAVLLQLQRGQYYGLNQIGAQVWKMLQKGRVPHPERSEGWAYLFNRDGILRLVDPCGSDLVECMIA